MYAGVSSEHDINSADIPEWKKLLIMKRRAGNLSGGGDEARLLVRGPVFGNDCKSNVNNALRNGGYASDNYAPGYANKFTVGRASKPVDFDHRDGDSNRSTATTTNLPGSFHDNTPPKTVTRTIGNINVELRSVTHKSTVDSQDLYSSDGSRLDRSSSSTFSESNSAVHESDDDACEDLQYGPGIVDRLRARFLNMGAKKQRKPVVRRFSSLENLPGSNAGPYRPRGVRQNGLKTSGNHHGNVKKAQSMETLLSSTPEQQIVSVGRRSNIRYGGGVKGRIMAKNLSPICVFTDENDEPEERSPSPILSPRPETSPQCNSVKSFIKRWDYNRSVSAPSIKENELPKPDIVKQFKKIFESPPADKSNVNTVTCTRFRKLSSNNNSLSVTPPSSAASKTLACNGAILGNDDVSQQQQTAGEEITLVDVQESEEVDTAKCNGAKERSDSDAVDGSLSNATTTEIEEEDYDSVADDSSYQINKTYSPVSDEDLSPSSNGIPFSPGTLVADDNAGGGARKLEREESEESFVVVGECKVTQERLPFSEQVVEDENEEATEALFQASREEETVAEQQTLVADVSEEEEADDISSEQTMVVASSAEDAPEPGGVGFQKPWQAVTKKPPQTTTSIVFDFRGKDVKPNISLNPTPFGCRPAKVSRRAGSPPRGSDSGAPAVPPRVNGVKDYLDDYDDDDWDEMDIGADLPAVCGIEFDGENVKVGRGALLETRNKKLTIQFDDHATSTFEYPSENTSPSPSDENGCWTTMDQDSSLSSLKPSIAIASPANSRLGLSNYTPHVLSSGEDFELGISRPTIRHSLPLPTEPIEDVPTKEEIVPANAGDAAGWSASETTDILF